MNIHSDFSIWDSRSESSCRIRSDSQTTGLPVADNLIDGDGAGSSLDDLHFNCIHQFTECDTWNKKQDVAGALQVQWLKLPAWKVRDREFEPHTGLQVSKKQNVSSRSLLNIQYCVPRLAYMCTKVA